MQEDLSLEYNRVCRCHLFFLLIKPQIKLKKRSVDCLENASKIQRFYIYFDFYLVATFGTKNERSSASFVSLIFIHFCISHLLHISIDLRAEMFISLCDVAIHSHKTEKSFWR